MHIIFILLVPESCILLSTDATFITLLKPHFDSSLVPSVYLLSLEHESLNALPVFGGFIFRFWFEAETPPPIEACFVGLSGNLGSAIETPLPRFRAKPMAASRASVVSGGECRSGGQPTRRARQPG